jgi:CHAT domain-containing protein
LLRKELAGRKPAPKAVAVLADPVFDKQDERLNNENGRNASAIPQTALAKTSTRSYTSTRELLRSVAESGVANEGMRIPRLPFTRREGEAILALAPANARKEAIDFAANRPTATSPELGQYRYLHFATHGLLNSSHPELSGLILSMVDEQGADQDGFLRAHEIFNLKLPAELVVLSGCRTGLGKEIKGEGIVGLTRALMYAGSARVLVSLWDISDQSTAQFMGSFYKGILGKQHLTPAAALRLAQIEMWNQKRWQAPYYWSAFVLQGEPR